MTENITKLPRIYSDTPLSEGIPISLESGQAHYFKNVLRRQGGDLFRIFNGRDGEYLAQIDEINKKSGKATAQRQIREQPSKGRAVHLLFSPIKKSRMDFLIEKAVELGVTDLHPALCARTEIRKIRHDRVTAQIIEASEQCERLDIPVFHEPVLLKEVITGWNQAIPLFWGRERTEAKPMEAVSGDCAYLVGPEGGFDQEEDAWLEKQEFIHAVSLGNNILRSETAALTFLAQVLLSS